MSLRSRSALVFSFVLLPAFLLFTSISSAQTFRGGINGIVTDHQEP